MNTELIFKYLSELKENNNREWYHQHKAEYKEANAQFEELVQELILAIGKQTAASFRMCRRTSPSSWCGTPVSATTNHPTIPPSAPISAPWESCRSRLDTI